MLPLLERAQTLLLRTRRAKTPVEPQPFELFCPAGHVVRGNRGANYRAVECPECGKVVFILPQSPLPAPEPPVVREPLKPRTRRRLRRLRLGVRAKYVGRRAREQLRQLKPPRRWFARERLVIAAIGMVVAVTGAVLFTRWRRESLEGVLQTKLVQGQALFDRGDFQGARVPLHEAAHAARSLGPDAAGAIDALQAAHEVDVLSNLADIRLDTIAAQAVEASDAGDLERWLVQFRVLYEGKFYVFDGVVTPTARENARSYDLDFVLFEGDHRFEVDVTSLDLLNRLDLTEPQRLAFGARLVAVEPSLVDPHRWLFRVDPESGVLLAHRRPFEQLGWPIDDELQALIDRQRRWAEAIAREDLE